MYVCTMYYVFMTSYDLPSSLYLSLLLFSVFCLLPFVFQTVEVSSSQQLGSFLVHQTVLILFSADVMYVLD